MSDASFNALVAALCSPVNSVRQQAERHYLGVRNSTPEQLILPLVGLIGDSLGSTNGDAAQARTMCAVLLRPLVKDAAVWGALPASSREAAKDATLRAVAIERTAYAQRSLCHSVATIAAATFGSGGSGASWPALIPCVLQLLADDHAPTREIAAQLVRVLTIALRQRCDLIERNADALLNALWERLGGDPSLAVRVVAARTVSALLACVHRDGAAARAWEAKLAPFLAPMLGAVEAALAAREEERGRAALEALVDVAELRPSFFAAPEQFEALARALVAIAACATLETGTRALALEVIIVLLEANPSLCAPNAALLARLFALTLDMMASVDGMGGGAPPSAEAQAEWEHALDSRVGPLGDDVGSASYTGGDAFERLSGAMGRGALAVAWPHIEARLSAASGGAPTRRWGPRWAALVAIALLGEGCADELRAQVC